MFAGMPEIKKKKKKKTIAGFRALLQTNRITIAFPF
jgi:hypothetical protein